MRVAVMQPYFVPHLGYYCLVEAVDVFVVLDSVNYTHRRWINRNRLVDKQGEPTWLSLHLAAPSQNRAIREHYLSEEGKWRSALIRKARADAGGTTISTSLIDQIEDYLRTKVVNLSWFNTEINKAVCAAIGIETIFVASDLDLDVDRALTGEDRIISICNSLGADDYVNPIGGASLYSEEKFAENGIDLHFFSPNLSILPERLRHSSVIQLLSEISVEEVAGIVREKAQRE